MAWGNDRIRDLVTRTILGESDHSQEGMVAVANVMKNRAFSGAWGDPNGGLTRAITARKQFSTWNTDDPKLVAYANTIKAIPTSDPRYQRAAAVADGVFGDQIPDNTNGATHFHAPGVSPDWAAGQNGQFIGGQYFYRLPLTAANTAGTAVTSPSSVGMQPEAATSSTGGAGGFAYGGGSAQDPGIDLRHLEPVFRARIDQLRADAAAAGIPTHIASGYRDNANQAGAYARLGAQHLAAAPGQSYHQFGRAVDLVADDPKQQAALTALADQPGRGLTSGAHFATPDRDHYQAAEGKTEPLLANPSTAPAVAAKPADVPAPQAQPVAATAPPGSPPIPGKPQNPSAGYVGPGSDKYSVVSGMTTGTSHNPQLTTAANWGNLFGGGATPTPPAVAPAVAAPPAPRPATAPTVPPGAPVNEKPGSPMSSIVPNWGAATPSNPNTYPAAAPQAMPGSGVTGAPAMTPGGPSMGFPAMTNPFGQPSPDQTASLPGSMLASAQNLIKLLFPTA